MPFGIKSAPSAFQRIMSELLHSCKRTLCYMDDILIAAKDKEKLRERVKAVRHVLEKANVLINEEKSTDESPEVEWLGYELSAEWIKPTKGKTDMIQALRAPTTVREVRQILGVINYYGKFIPRLAIIAQPIHDLLKKNKGWKWDMIHEEALMDIKAAILKEKRSHLLRQTTIC